MKKLKAFYLSLFVTQRFYKLLIAVVIAYILVFFFTILNWPVFIFALLFVAAALVDSLLLYSRKKGIIVRRVVPEKFSNGDENTIKFLVSSNYSFTVSIHLIDELPVQFQNRNFNLKGKLAANSKEVFIYHLKPNERGEYIFGNINCFTTSFLQLVERRVIEPAEHMVACYPSFLQMRRYQLLAATNKLNEAGIKQIRRKGHSLEFEQIREYVQGDDYRTINWKASSRKNDTLMVNSYTDEKSQQVYCIINAGRVMKMPFEGMTLLDYAINSSLILSSVALTKQDKAGLITYGDKWINLLPAERSPMQMNKILFQLYNLTTQFNESDIEKLYINVKTRINHRSLLIYYTNYESISSMERDLPFLKILNKSHLLLLVFFENTELKSLLNAPATTVENVYTKTIAEKFVYEKRLMVKELNRNGIMAVLTSPKNLTINTLNKYLEIKAKALI
ncbi:MAG: DUF58 domain-containing protein [Chitinophaga sp.]|jgi:uncharacterized protein (DUF58 family)|nr:DUF58 domain-containing protein [Chitinophaga sp.]